MSYLKHTEIEKVSLSTSNNGSYYYVKYANNGEEVLYFNSRHNEELHRRFKKVKSTPQEGDTIKPLGHNLIGAKVFKLPKSLDEINNLIENNIFSPTFENYERLTQKLGQMRLNLISNNTEYKIDEEVFYKGMKYKICGFNLENKNLTANLLSNNAEIPAKINVALTDLSKSEQI